MTRLERIGFGLMGAGLGVVIGGLGGDAWGPMPPWIVGIIAVALGGMALTVHLFLEDVGRPVDA